MNSTCTSTKSARLFAVIFHVTIICATFLAVARLFPVITLLIGFFVLAHFCNGGLLWLLTKSRHTVTDHKPLNKPHWGPICFGFLHRAYLRKGHIRGDAAGSWSFSILNCSTNKIPLDALPFLTLHSTNKVSNSYNYMCCCAGNENRTF